ncbi:hypothetical protein LCR_01360 [Aeromonas enteropelogenes]|uniref:Uncharacterized protein n=1 Tax=Aeromonas enteropelogenes TaxID=29489 RepID=A0A175VEP3_AEREN|nr:hypothetical protein LCR_01360 [Aeromonas enteropelogenes]
MVFFMFWSKGHYPPWRGLAQFARPVREEDILDRRAENPGSSFRRSCHFEGFQMSCRYLEWQNHFKYMVFVSKLGICDRF